MMKSLVIYGCLLVVVQAQSEIVLRFLNLNRENLTISKSCDSDLKTVNASLAKNEIWALKCECQNSFKNMLYECRE